jgi:hypothetical protein
MTTAPTSTEAPAHPAYGDKVIAVETAAAEPIPLTERHGSPVHLLWTWSSPNIEFATGPSDRPVEGKRACQNQRIGFGDDVESQDVAKGKSRHARLPGVDISSGSGQSGECFPHVA